MLFAYFVVETKSTIHILVEAWVKFMEGNETVPRTLRVTLKR